MIIKICCRMAVARSNLAGRLHVLQRGIILGGHRERERERGGGREREKPTGDERAGRINADGVDESDGQFRFVKQFRVASDNV